MEKLLDHEIYLQIKKTIDTKIRILEMCTLLSLYYGAQTGTMVERLIKRLQATQHRMERSILNIKLSDKTPIHNSTA